MTLDTDGNSTRLIPLETTRESVGGRVRWVQLRAQQKLHGAWYIQKLDNEGLVGTANSVDSAQPTQVVPTLEPEICASEFTTIRERSLILMAGDKLISSGHKPFTPFTVYFPSGVASSHGAVAVIACATTLVRRSWPVKNGTAERNVEDLPPVPKTY